MTSDPGQKKIIGSFVDRYSLDVTVDDFCPEGIVLTDTGGHRVAPVYGEIRGNMIHTRSPYADIMVIGLDGGILAGWVRSDSMIDMVDRHMVPVKSLNKMPTDFNFIQECPHMSVFGGVHSEDSNGWECLGCGIIIVK